MAEPLIRLTGLRRAFPAGEGEIVAVKDIDLSIAEGEMVAIIGASGSGKSTLMNLLGCLDQPTAGSYRIAGREVAELEPDAQARLRREYFGFIFQRYHLLGELTAIGNVEMPAIYAGMGLTARRDKAARILERLGMAGRFEHRPGKLSGGQQQRVSIARALINDARIILADEPTGALDSQSGGEVLRILDELHAEGRTIIIVTHDMDVARRAERIIEIRDGAIVADRANQPDHPPAPAPAGRAAAPGPDRRGLGVLYGRLREAFRMAVLSMLAHKMRTLLTMLGIIIGIASVVSVVALGTGSQKQILSNIASLGTNTLEIFPGKDFGDLRSGKVETLVVSDADVLARQPYAAGVTPTVTTSKTIRFGNIEASAQVNGVGDQYFTVRGAKIDQGTFFGPEDVKDLAQSVVIDDNARQALFSGFAGSPVGQVIFVGDVPCRIVGVMKQQTSGFGSNSTPSVYLPYTTVQGRILGDFTLRSISLRVADSASMAVAEQAVTDLLTQRHRTKDFFILNTNDIRDTITSTTETMTLLVAAIAVISLIVGGIGVMNIMLVSVSERISEIGVRMAVGARRSDILQQFLIEATLVCLIGGFLGISAALGFGFAFNQLGMNFKLAFSGTSIVSAVLCSTLIGMVFGYLPARNASLLDPVDALTRD